MIRYRLTYSCGKIKDITHVKLLLSLVANVNANRFWEHVYFVYPSTDISVDISTDSRPMYRSTYRLSDDRYIGRDIDRLSADIATEICRSTYRPMCQLRYRPNDGRHIDRLSADISVDLAADTLPIR